jgi:hypothetical protein
MTCGTPRSVQDRECICTGQVCPGLQVVTVGMGLFQLCNSYLVMGAARCLSKVQMPIAAYWRASLDT